MLSHSNIEYLATDGRKGEEIKMQRKVVQIAKKYLKDGYDDNKTEIIYLVPWNVLSMYVDAEGNNTDDKIRAFAKEVVEVIRGIDQSELILLPTKEEAMQFLYDIYPDESLPGDVRFPGDKMGEAGNEEADEFVAYHAGKLLEWLKRMHTPKMWRSRQFPLLREG